MVLGPAHMPRARVLLELAEMAGKGDLLGVGQLLAAKDQNRVFVHAGLDRGDRVIVERAAAIDAVDLAGKSRMQPADRYRHGAGSLARSAA